MAHAKLSLSIFLFLLLFPVTSCFSTEKQQIQPYLSLFAEAENYLNQGEVIRSVYCIEMLDNMYPSMKDKGLRRQYIDLLNVLSQACYDSKLFSQALDLSYKGIDYCEEEDYSEPLGVLYKTAGNVMSNFGDYETANRYYLLSCDYSLNHADTLNAARACSNLVINSYVQNNLEQAYYYFDELNSYSSVQSADYYRLEPYVYYYTWATIKKLEQSYDSAFYYFKLASNCAVSNDLPPLYLTSCNSEMAQLFDTIGMVDSAKHYYLMNEQLALLYNLPEESVSSFRALSLIAQKEGDMVKAFYYKERYLAISDSIFNAGELRKIEQNRFEYNEANNRYQINRLNKVNEAKNKWIRMILFLLLGVTIGLLFVYAQKHRLNSAYNTLYKRNRELLHFEALCFDQNRRISELTTQLEQPIKDGEVPIKVEQLSSSYQPTDLQRQKIIDAIEHYMRDVDTICNPDFSLEQLAVLTNINYKYLSQIINETYHQNFRSFLSGYRIREAQRMLSNFEEYGNYTIQSIGERVGYRSQSTFISVFKKTTGLTPSQYLQLSFENRETDGLKSEDKDEVA